MLEVGVAMMQNHIQILMDKGDSDGKCSCNFGLTDL
jgi:hypothetical protein